MSVNSALISTHTMYDIQDPQERKEYCSDLEILKSYLDYKQYNRNCGISFCKSTMKPRYYGHRYYGPRLYGNLSKNALTNTSLTRPFVNSEIIKSG